MLSDKQIKEFQIIYKKRFNKKITREEALAKGVKLISLMKLIHKPIKVSEYQKLNEHKQLTN